MLGRGILRNVRRKDWIRAKVPVESVHFAKKLGKKKQAYRAQRRPSLIA